MRKINYWRVLGGGLIAGVVINLIETAVNALWLKDQWAEAMKALNRTTQLGSLKMTSLHLWGFLIGISAVWLYSEMRDRYGPGWRCALCAALAVWAIGIFSGTITGLAMGMFPPGLLMIGLAVGLFEVVLATELGAWYYRPAE